MRNWKLLLCLICVGLLTACAAKRADLPHDAGDLSAKLKQGYVQKVEHTLLVMDSSASMTHAHQKTEKFSTARNLLLRMNSAIAGLKLDTGLHVFGPVMGEKKKNSNLVYGMKRYDSAELAAAVKAIEPDGVTPVAKALSDSIETLRGSKGRIAVIMISDGNNTEQEDPLQAAADLKKAYGERICIYTVLVGDDPTGKALLQGIARAGECGFATTASALSPGRELADFLETVFLEKAPPPVVVAPPAPKPVPVPEKKPAPAERIVLRGINFDFDKSDIKPEYVPVLDTAVGILKERPNLKMVIEGHTCNIGTEAYNQGLSERRARSVHKYLVQNGVNPANLSSIGYGELRPMADNRTRSGRELNRRVEFNIMP